MRVPTMSTACAVSNGWWSACELKTFMANVNKLFPGAKVRTTGEGTEDAKLVDKVLELLNRPASAPSPDDSRAWRTARQALAVSVEPPAHT